MSLQWPPPPPADLSKMLPAEPAVLPGGTSRAALGARQRPHRQ